MFRLYLMNCVQMQMRPIAKDVARSVVCVPVCLCLCVGYTGQLCNNVCTDRDAIIWGADSSRFKETRITWGPDPPQDGAGTFEGEMLRPVPTHGEIACTQRTQVSATPTQAYCRRC